MSAAEQGRPWVSGRAAHHIGVFRFGFKHDGTGRVDHQFEKQDMHRQEGQRPAEQAPGSSDIPAIGTWTATM